MILQEFIESKGYAFSPNQLDGTYHEYADHLGNKGWYIGSNLSTGKVTFTFGDWRNPDATFTFVTDSEFTGEEQNELEEKTKAFEKEKGSRQEEARKTVCDIFSRWEKLGSQGESKYITAKNLPSQRIKGTIVKPDGVSGTVLVIPLYDEAGQIWNFQTIFGSGEKQFFNFARIKGCFFKFEGSEETVVCEGFATGAAIYCATGKTVVVAFAISNLKAVIKKFPGASLACDYDGATHNKMITAGHKDPINPGFAEAQRLSAELGITFYCPVPETEACADNIDFCDLWVSSGGSAVCKRFEEPMHFFKAPNLPPSGPAVAASAMPTGPINLAISKWINGLQPMNIRVSKSGKPMLPEEMEVARALFDYYEGLLIKSGVDMFRWTGTHWSEFTDADEDNILRQIMVLHADFGTWNRFKNVFQCFQKLIPTAPRNMYYTNPEIITFNNGTLVLDFVKGKWDIHFREHRKTDYSTNLIPYDYDPKAKNDLFEETLQNILGDHEFETKRRAVAQMFGSALAPMYPRLFLLVGKSGSGKSTLILLATALVSEGNVSSVQPADFMGFNMEPMAGKLINAVTDLDVTKPISDSITKQIEDRVPIAINRKFKKAIFAPFPAVHIFGANDIPPTLERGSMAHTRRWTFVLCDHFQTDINTHDKHRVNRIREAGMAGVVNFAIEGLKDLLNNNGHFFVPTSGQEKMKTWQVDNDPIASFLASIREGEVDDLALDAEERCYTKVLWENFVAWHLDSYNAKPRIPKRKFFVKMENHLGSRKTYQGFPIFCGVASQISPVRSGKKSWGEEKNHLSGEVSKKPPYDAGQKLIENSNEFF